MQLVGTQKGLIAVPATFASSQTKKKHASLSQLRPVYVALLAYCHCCCQLLLATTVLRKCLRYKRAMALSAPRRPVDRSEPDDFAYAPVASDELE